VLYALLDSIFVAGIMRLRKNIKGFTLIEIIAVLVLTGMLTAIAGFGLAEVAKSFIFAKETRDTLQKGQVAMLRILKELVNARASSIAGSSDTSITFLSEHSSGPVNYTISLNGSNLELQSGAGTFILTDDVNNFDLNYYATYNGASFNSWQADSRIIEVALVLDGAEGITSSFSVRVAPRNL